MTDNDIPMWALDQASQVADFKTWEAAKHFYGEPHPTCKSIRAHAALIAKHEQPPVDPDLIEARECAALVCDNVGRTETAAMLRSGQMDDFWSVNSVLIRLQREKEGKRA